MKLHSKYKRFGGSIRRSCMTTGSHIRFEAGNLRKKLRQIKERLLRIPAIQLVVSTFQGLGRDDASHLAAGVAYYSLLSLFPLIMVLIALLGLLLPAESLHKDLSDFVKDNFPGSVDLLESNIREDIDHRGTLGVLSLLLLSWSGSGMFRAVRRAINRVWGIPSEQDRSFYKGKLRDLAMTFGVGFLLILSISITMVFTILSDANVSWMNLGISIGAWLLAFLLLVIVFLLLYKYIPHSKTSWRHIWPGAVLAAVLFEITKHLFTLYLHRFANYEAVYGSVGSVIILLVWIYICAFILVLGAELSSEYGRMGKKEVQIIST